MRAGLATVLTIGLTIHCAGFLFPAFAQSAKRAAQKALKKAAEPRLPADVQAYVEKNILDANDDWDESLLGPRFRWDLFDLNVDGKAEYFIVSYCSPTGNCQLHILEWRGEQYVSILNANLVQVVCVRGTNRRGYRDLEISSHSSAFESPTRVFRFNGKNYEVADEYNVRWEYDDKSGKWRQVEGPKKTGCKLLLRPGNYGTVRQK